MRGAQRLTEMHDTGTLDWSVPKRTSKFELNPFFEAVANEFLSAGRFSVKGHSDARWVSRKYFSWLIHEGHNDLSNVGANEVQKYMIHCSNRMPGTSIHNVKLYMKKLYLFLCANGYSKESYSGLFEFRVSRESKLYPAAEPDEVAKILAVIDKRVPSGKRDYAMILLGAVTGLRACDIANLKLTDIDWRRGEIRIAQAKTGKPLALPLTADIGAAIKDYVINGRGESSSDAVFITLRSKRGFLHGEGLRYLFKKYRLQANLPRNAYDGKGFHSLRRAVGRNLVTAGVPVESVAQILGDEKVDSTKKYIALDSRHLKECALDFAGIGNGVQGQ